MKRSVVLLVVVCWVIFSTPFLRAEENKRIQNNVLSTQPTPANNPTSVPVRSKIDDIHQDLSLLSDQVERNQHMLSQVLRTLQNIQSILVDQYILIQQTKPPSTVLDTEKNTKAIAIGFINDYQTALSLMNDENNIKAIVQFEKLLQHMPSNAYQDKIYYFLGTLYNLENEPTVALKYLQKINPNSRTSDNTFSDVDQQIQAITHALKQNTQP